MFYPMIRLSTESDASFAPYTNICPISGRTEINLEGCGVNIWDEEWETGNIADTTGGDISSDNAIRSKYIEVKAGLSYRIGGSGANSVRVHTYDANKNWIEYLGNVSGSSFTIGSGVKYIRFRTLSSYGGIYNNNISINYPSTDTTYHPYTKSTDLTISLGQTVYGGTLDVENGVLVVDKARQKISDLTWTSATGNYAKFTTNSLIGVIKGSDTEKVVISELYKSEDNTTVPANQNHIYANNGGQVKIWDDAYASSDVSAWLTARGDSYICYELATPVTIQLTPHQISLLEGVNNISTTGDKITLTYRDGKMATLGDLLEVEKKIPSATAQHNYSTEEQVVGTWIDGKPLYEKTIDLGYLPDNGTKQVNHNISNLRFVTNINGFAYSTTILPLPNIHPNGIQYAVSVGITATTINISTGTDRSSFYGYLTLQYTKTTD